MAEVMIRDVEPADAEALAQWADDPAVAEEVPFATVASIPAWIGEAQKAAAAAGRRSRWLLAIDHGGERAVGVAVLSIDSRADARAEIGFVVRPDRWRNGIASRAVSAVVELAFDDLALHRLWAICDPENVAAHRVLERNGFELEGLLRGDRRRGAGWTDSLLYGLIAVGGAV